MARHRLFLALTLGPIAIVMLVLPLVFRLPTNVAMVCVSDLSAAGHGVFAVTSEHAYRLIPQTSLEAASPAAAASSASARLPASVEVRVRARQMGLPSEYVLRSVEDDREVALRRGRDGAYLVLRPVLPLAPGVYEFSAPRDSVWGEVDRYLLNVGETR